MNENSAKWYIEIWYRDILKISIFLPAIRYDISISNRYFRYIDTALMYNVTFKKLSLSLSLSLSLFYQPFPDGPGSSGTRMSLFWILLELRMMEAVATTGAIRRAKHQSNHHHQQTNIQFFTGQMPFLSPNQQCQSTEGKIFKKLWH